MMSNTAPIRVCALRSSYEGSTSDMKEYEGDLVVSPSHFITGEEDAKHFVIDNVPIKKATAYGHLRQLIKSGKYDVFYNLCDGAKDEDRAGEEVVKTLEEFKCAFTGAVSKYYEISKPDMKMIAHYEHIKTAASAVIEEVAEVERRCAHMTFPVIIKHISGYSSVGMTKDCKCPDMDHLKKRVAKFLDEYQVALVEEFIDGDEVTVLACADSSAPDGIRMFHPVMINFPEGEDFKHFDLKWCCFEDMQWFPVPQDYPALEEIKSIGKKAFKHMMGGVGYGRCDLRINRATGEAVFLEINPNCGIMYPPGEEGSADWILKLESPTAHRDFAKLQIQEAIARQHRERPLFKKDFLPAKGYFLAAQERIAKGQLIMANEGRAFRLFSKPHVMNTWDSHAIEEHFRSSAWPVGSDHQIYAVPEADPTERRTVNHSCDPNMTFSAPQSLDVLAARDIETGEELTMDYLTFCDEIMRPFQCNCASAKCRGTVQPRTPLRPKTNTQLFPCHSTDSLGVENAALSISIEQ